MKKEKYYAPKVKVLEINYELMDGGIGAVVASQRTAPITDKEGKDDSGNPYTPSGKENNGAWSSED